MKTAKNYLLRGIPFELWIKAKHYSADSGKTLRQVLIDALARYING